jgi:hypothetical protein
MKDTTNSAASTPQVTNNTIAPIAPPTKGIKRKDLTGDATDNSQAKKLKKGDDNQPAEQLRLLSVNTCGFDADKWQAIQNMDQTHNFDLICFQECINDQKKLNQIIGKNYTSIVTSERPTDLSIDGNSAAPSVGMNRSYALLSKEVIKSIRTRCRTAVFTISVGKG